MPQISMPESRGLGPKEHSRTLSCLMGPLVLKPPPCSPQGGSGAPVLSFPAQLLAAPSLACVCALLCPLLGCPRLLLEWTTLGKPHASVSTSLGGPAPLTLPPMWGECVSCLASATSKAYGVSNSTGHLAVSPAPSCFQSSHLSLHPLAA